MLHVKRFEYRGERCLWVEFSDGRSGELEWCDANTGPMTEPLRDPAFFGRARLNVALGVIEWPNGFDVAPEYLYFLAFRHDPALAATFQRWGYLECGGEAGSGIAAENP